MAGSLKVNRASNTLTNPGMYRMVGLLTGGMVLSVLLTGWMRNNVVDIGMQGGDAVYSLATAGLVLASPLNTRTARPVAMGSALGGVLTILNEFGVTQTP